MESTPLTISFIVPTIGRDTLARTLASIEQWPGDELHVIHSWPKSYAGSSYGNEERNLGIERATCDFLAFIDDDDFFVPGHRALQHDAMLNNPLYPTLFRVQYPNGRTLWKDDPARPWPRARHKCGNIDTGMILVPNRKEHFPSPPWEIGSRRADFHFINRWAWPKRLIIWREEVIQMKGQEDINIARKSNKGE